MVVADLSDMLLQRPVFVALAFIGAAIVTLGSFLLRRRDAANPRLGKVLLYLGYAVTAASIAIFIIIGFFREG